MQINRSQTITQVCRGVVWICLNGGRHQEGVEARRDRKHPGGSSKFVSSLLYSLHGRAAEFTVWVAEGGDISTKLSLQPFLAMINSVGNFIQTNVIKWAMCHSVCSKFVS